MRRYTRRQLTGEGPCRRTMTPINRQVTLPDRLGVYLAASAELSFSTFGLAGWQSLSPSECTAILWYKYSVHMLCYLLCAVDMLTTTWSDWQQPETHGTGTTTGLPSFHSPYYLFFFTTPVQRLFCAISLHWPVCRSACALHLFALDQVRLRNEARVYNAKDSTGCCLPEIGIADHHHLQNEFVSVCMHRIHIHGSTPSSAMSCRVTHTCYAAPWPGVHCVLYLLVLAHRRGSTTRALGRIDTMLIAFTLLSRSGS